MRKILLFISFIFVTHIGFSQYITAQDDASNYASWSNGDNEGFGFSAWDLTDNNNDGTSTYSGYYIGTNPTQNGREDISTLDSKVFGLYANTGSGTAYAVAKRLFVDDSFTTRSLNVGESFSFNFAFSWNLGKRGINLYGEDGTAWLFNVEHSGSDALQSTGGELLADIYNKDVLIKFSWKGGASNNLSISVTADGSTTTTTHTIASSPVGFTFYTERSGTGDNSNYEPFFNSLKVEADSPSGISSACSVVIDGNVELASDETLSCSDLTISSGNSFTIKSDATGTGSLISTGTVTGDITIERFISGYSGTEAADGWHFISSPVNEQPIADFHTAGGANDFYKYDEPDGMWVNRTDDEGNLETAFEDNFEVGKGYLIAFSSDQTKEFIGSINTNTVEKNTSFASLGEFKGYNLLGNPYTSAIDWDLVDRTVTDAVHVIISSGVNAGEYADWVEGVGDLSDGIIPAMQGFFVLADAVGQKITMDPSDRTLNSANFYKGANTALNTMKVNVNQGEGYSNLYLRFNETATNDFDRNWDAHKLFGYSDIPKIFAYDDNTKYSINSLPSNQTTHIVDFGIRTVDSEEYTLSFSDISEVSDLYSNIQLEDRATGSWIEIEEGTEYNFIADEGNNMDRFKLHFGATGINEIQKEALQAYASGHQLYIVGEEGPAELNVFNLQGQQVLQEQIQLNAQYSRTLNLKSGIYLVSLRSQNETKTTKISIR